MRLRRLLRLCGELDGTWQRLCIEGPVVAAERLGMIELGGLRLEHAVLNASGTLDALARRTPSSATRRSAARRT